jgi:hypothetical protein
MKNMIRSAIIMGLVLLFAGTTQKASAQTEDVSLQSFYDELSPYGTWIQDPQYGYVWRPDVDQEEFRPYYTNGRWAMTEYGNTWVSNYDWGWAPFHYGRWIYNDYNQWVWLPDTVWGPAWVSWRSGGGHYGWAPLGPSISIGINIGRGGYRVPDMCWNFIPYNNIYYNSYPRYNYGRNRVYIQNTVIINNTYVRNNRTYYTGPRVDDIRRQTNQRVDVYSVNRSNRPGASRIESNSVSIYQPRPSRDGNNSNAAPRNAVRGNINRESIGRDNINSNRASDRGENRYQGNRGSIDRNNSYQGNRNEGRDENNRYQGARPSSEGRTSDGAITRSPRNDNGTTTPDRARNGRSGFPTRDGNNEAVTNQRPSVFGRNRETNTPPQRIERGEPTTQPQAQPEQRMPRSREIPQQQPQPQQQRVERERSAPQPAPQQRMERPQQQSAPRAERMERPQSQPQQSGGGENRGGGRSSGGRPGRG